MPQASYLIEQAVVMEHIIFALFLIVRLQKLFRIFCYILPFVSSSIALRFIDSTLHAWRAAESSAKLAMLAISYLDHSRIFQIWNVCDLQMPWETCWCPSLKSSSGAPRGPRHPWENCGCRRFTCSSSRPTRCSAAAMQITPEIPLHRELMTGYSLQPSRGRLCRVVVSWTSMSGSHWCLRLQLHRASGHQCVFHLFHTFDFVKQSKVQLNGIRTV